MGYAGHRHVPGFVPSKGDVGLNEFFGVVSLGEWEHIFAGYNNQVYLGIRLKGNDKMCPLGYFMQVRGTSPEGNAYVVAFGERYELIEDEANIDCLFIANAADWPPLDDIRKCWYRNELRERLLEACRLKEILSW